MQQAGLLSHATGNIFVQRALILRGGWHQPLMGPVTAHLISVFAARAPACAFILCFIGQVASGILRSYSNPDSLSHFVARAPACALTLRFLLDGSFWHFVVVLKSRCLIAAFVVRAPACALICGLLGESLPTFHGLTRAQIPHLRICGACASMRLHFLLY